MKRILALLMLLMLLVPLCTAAEEQIIINKIKDPNNDFAFPEDAKLLEIYFPNIYDAAAALIRYGEYTMLFDCAGECWDQVPKLLDYAGVTTLTYACNSHPHTDHTYGFQFVLADHPAGEFIRFFEDDFNDSNPAAIKVFNLLREMGIPFRQLGHGDTLPFGDVKISFMQMDDPENAGNNPSALMRVELGERNFLFASDILKDGQHWHVTNGSDLKADILQHPHHGYNRMQPVFLDAVDPELVVVTSLPNAALGLSYLKDKKVPYVHTHQGILKLTTDGTVWVLERIK